MTITDDIQQVIADPSTSEWLKQALETALQRDAADAANDAEKLADLLDRRFYATIAHAHGRNQAYGE